ncbi:MarR family transcriptional regulator [Clostridiaceae bacterium]|nr:MarR family transcriptional regulator [Clostridiaceae bacterium]
MEFDVLMFLANNPQFDTAAEIVKLRKLTKSNVSVALKQLAARDLLEPYYQDGNRKTLHLRLLPAAAPILEDGRAAQGRFGTILFGGFSSSDLAQFQSMMERISGNVRQFMQEV